ncbi:MAG TPA: hypothetical protein DEP72_08880 [Clostridiales bacterium]|nr:MAG: hypothetical protein A2Y18_03820 [Clostridiales bacterium GWD2_32_19]HCC08253.1 hypothetical protein [Clostridiales bacterium]
MEKRKKTILEYRFPLVLRPWELYYIFIFMIITAYAIVYGYAYFKGIAFDSQMFKFLFLAIFTVIIGVLMFVMIKFDFYVKLYENKLLIKHSFEKSFEIKYSDIKNICLNIEMVKLIELEIPNIFMNIISNKEGEAYKLNISKLSDETKGLLIEIIYIRNPLIELNEHARNIKSYNYKKYRQALNKASIGVVVAGAGIVIIHIILIIFFK